MDGWVGMWLLGDCSVFGWLISGWLLAWLVGGWLVG